MIGEMYRYAGIKAVQVPIADIGDIAGIVHREVEALRKQRSIDVQVHYVPIVDNGSTTSILVMLHYGHNVSPF